MRRSLTLSLAAGSLAALTIPLTASPAAALENDGWCPVIQVKHFTPTKTAQGWLGNNWSNMYRLDPVNLTVKDDYADGHHVAVRLVTWQLDGGIHYWKWRHNYDGNNKSKSWSTEASDNEGIAYAAVQAGVFEGDDLLISCISAKHKNPTW